jgi:hypothetical protein
MLARGGSAEIAHELRVGKQESLLLKLDFKKAYDRVG